MTLHIEVVVVAKSTSDAYDPNVIFPPDPNSPQSTINTVAREIHEAGGDVLPIAVDVRDHESVKSAVDQTVNVGSVVLQRHSTLPCGMGR